MSAENVRALTTRLEIINGCWMPVFLETVAGSQERICVAVAAIDEQGNHRVERTLPPSSVTALFGRASEGINRCIDWVVVDLAEHLSTNKHFDGWLAPYSGFVAGKHEEAGAANLNGLLDKAKSLSTALSHQ